VSRRRIADNSRRQAGRHDFERELIRRVARRLRELEQSDLEAELWIKLLKIKSRPRKRVRNRTAYLRTALFRHAKNLLRDRPKTEKRKVSIHEPDEEDSVSITGVVLSYRDSDLDNQIALRAAVQEFPPNLRFLWETLVQVGGNQVEAGKILGLHRNTVRLWLKQIEVILIRHEVIRPRR
jgi:RNA polymerase sigma factor (sigma-70 family)